MKTPSQAGSHRSSPTGTGNTPFATVALLLLLPCCLGSTNTVIETFDRWPPPQLSFPYGGASHTNLLGNGALRLAHTFPAANEWRWEVFGGWHGGADVLKGSILEHRLDLLKFSTTQGGYFILSRGSSQAEELTSYGLLLGEQKLLLVKYTAYPKVFARLLYEEIGFPLNAITLVLRYQWAGDTFEIRIQILDKANGDATLFDRTVADTPGKDPVVPAPWAPGEIYPNEDPGEPYAGPGGTWFAIMHSDRPATTIEAVIDNCQWSAIGVGIDEFLGAVYTNSVGRTLPYRLFVPPGYDPANRYPLVLSLHGMGECGTDNRAQVEGQPGFKAFASAENQAKQPCFLLAPHSPGDWMIVADRVLDLLTHLQTRYSIDPDRLYVTGLSMGGWGTFDYLAYRPEMFAAGVPMSCATGPSSDSVGTTAPRVAQIPLWAFCGALDTDYDHIGDVRRMIDALRTAGGRPIYTEYSRGAHGIWTDAYQTPGLFDWLMRQRRGVSVAGPPEVTIQSPTQEPSYATSSTNLDLSGIVSPDLNVSRVLVTARTTTQAEGTNAWSKSAVSLRAGRTNQVTVKAYAPVPPLILGGETIVTDLLTVVHKNLLLEVILAGEQFRLRWTSGAESYVVERCADLSLRDWTSFQTTSATEIALPRAEQQQFYRVRLGP